MAKANTKKAGKIKVENVIYCGNNLTWLKKSKAALFNGVIKSKALEHNINFDINTFDEHRRRFESGE